MKEDAGRVIRYGVENQPIPGCTHSKQVYNQNGLEIFVFSLASHTEISPESYEYHKLIHVITGKLEVITSTGESYDLSEGDCIVSPKTIPVGMKTKNGCVYVELGLRKEEGMNEVIKAGEVFQMKDLLPYGDGQIVNMDLVSNEKMKFVLMSFDAGTGLTEHAAPGEALVFALDGEAIIGYEGQDHVVKAGETFKFDKMGKHSVTAKERFKMALLLVLE